MIAEVIRSGFTESRHRGLALALAADGSVAVAAGAVAEPMLPRSANKPAQAAAMVRAGLKLDGEALALVAASHAGEEFHVTGVRAILANAGLDETALGCPPALPQDAAARQRLVRAGGEAGRVWMNCSGKHAGMLVTCVVAGWPTRTYRDPGHPLQRAVQSHLADLAGEPVTAVTVDGCGAPAFGLTLTGLARMFRAVTLAEPGSAERLVADAMRAHPAWASGTHRPDRALMEAVPGLLVKSGAEGVQAFALPDGRAGAVKVEDGSSRAVPALTVALLRALGVTAPGLGELATAPVHGGGQVVGEVRVTPAW